jgi:hypothetical protein
MTLALGWTAGVGASGTARLARRARPTRTDRLHARAVRATAGSVVPHSAGVARLEEFARRPGKKAVFQAAQSGVITVVRGSSGSPWRARVAGRRSEGGRVPCAVSACQPVA